MNCMQKLAEIFIVKQTDVDRLAFAFSMKMQIAVTGETLSKIVVANRASGRCTPCASHDYCDAAEVMREAWESLWTEPFDWDNALVEAAWRKARQNEFGF